MRVLIACEFSGVVRDAFRARGHHAMSCDLLPSETSGEHYQGDIRDIFAMTLLGYESFDLMVAHPPCTYLANSGARWWRGKGREQTAGLDFVQYLLAAPIPKIALENPVGRISTAIRKPDQIIQPFHHGHAEWKTTCLWLKGLPLLTPTAWVTPDGTVGGGKKPGRISSRLARLPPGPNRARERSRTYQGIANAMAAQWG